MKCEDFRQLIEDYFDGALDQESATRVTAHTAACAECDGFYQRMSREQEVYARYQRDVEVTPLLWASIEDRIKQEHTSEPAGPILGPMVEMISGLRRQLAGVFAAPRLSPAFAAALVIVAIGATVFVMSRLNSHDTSQVATGNRNEQVKAPDPSNQIPGVTATAPAPGDGKEKNLVARAGATAPETPKAVANPRSRQSAPLTPTQLVRDAEQKYLTAIAMLSRDVSRRRSQLDPIMLARFDASLSEIDRTIKETRQVVRGNPEDPIALQYLLAAYSKKVDVLREMTTD